ncbi:helicase-related protein [Fulvivirgaceae bacterium BMA12]|uniref:Helicase-related protein n=1 Tax=Agaribacillus aureus TaxID=3051825 RepID=A0ABT8LBK7_9BACT|nr:helicase-related protein [Fulvivirgaceae bacterium BMA12]
MKNKVINKPGSLVKFRDRDWMVLPSDDPELLMIKPLGGSDEEITGVYIPLELDQEEVKPSSFRGPSVHELGDFETAKLLFDASRLSFRNASGPFRCFGKLSFRPRAYQIVPLVMVLKQEVVRLMIADDVGIGKTVEALIILKELLERGEIKRFAVICSPHLCDQWQSELKDKLDIESDIIRSSTAASLDRRLPDDQSIFHHLPYQVISIDYIKSDKRKGIFLNDCPELVIVDEAHTCALPEGSKSKSQQQRHSLLSDLSKEESRHLLLLTATPHSGKDLEFTSLLGLLKSEFRSLNFESIDQKDRRKIANHFIQRKRENIKRWLHEVTIFPERDAKEVGYNLSQSYRSFYLKVLDFARSISSVQDDESKQKKMIRSWAAISLIRGVMSSPRMAIEMLKRQHEKKDEMMDEVEVPSIEGTLFENLELVEDAFREELMDRSDLRKEQINLLYQQAERLCNLESDTKALTAINILKKWTNNGFYPIVFCKYIATARYIGELLKSRFPKSTDIQIVTSELPDERRKEIVQEMGNSSKRILVATDCLSEGINLQEYFTAVLHYDLPWNPNRIEQRDGRVDRFGQDAPEIKTYLLYGEDNPMDTFVLEVLIRKIRSIQKSIGVSIALGDETRSIMAQAADHILKGDLTQEQQLRLFADEKVTNELEIARRKGENLRSIFAHESVDPQEIQNNLIEVDEAIGDIDTVEHFVTQSVTHLGASINKDKQGYTFNPQNLPKHLRDYFGKGQSFKISFESPTPKGYKYIGRNHLFVEQLCQFMLSLAFDGHAEYNQVARMSEIQTEAVDIKTTLVTFRVRNVIKEVQSNKKVVAEEMYLWGYKGSLNQSEFLSYAEAKKLLQDARSSANLSIERQKGDLIREIDQFLKLRPKFIELATERAEHLVESHGRFKKLVGGKRYETVSPVLPPDVMGVYLLVPKPKVL